MKSVNLPKYQSYFYFKYLSRESGGKKRQTISGLHTCRCEPAELVVSSWTTCCRRAASRPHSTSRAPAAWKTRAHSTTKHDMLALAPQTWNLYIVLLLLHINVTSSWREEEMSRRPTFPQSRAGARNDHHSILQSGSWSEADKYPIQQKDPRTC